jgi:hypothetical protein
MMFVLRLMFWILLICLLLPGQREDNRQLMSSAGKALNDLRGFCGRNPDVCEDARRAATVVLARLKSGTEVVQQWMADDGLKHISFGQKAEPSSYEGQRPVPKSGIEPGHAYSEPVAQWNDNLKASDRELPWRGPDKM